ncbi:MAG: adenylate/guanylate cyclase domain-containing protein [Acidimicrobiia bacterium]
MLNVPEVRYAHTGGGSIAYQVFGEGPTDIVVTPGFVSHLDLQWTMPSYTRFFEMLSSFARVIIFDKRGTGLSDPTDDAVRFDQRAEDIVAVMDAADSERAVLMGVSEGGPLSILFAAQNPDRVQSLVLYGTFSRGSLLGGDLIDAFDDAIENWGSGKTASIFSASEGGSAVRTRLAAVFERASASPGMARALVDSVRTADVTEVLPLLSMPVLVLNRRDDPFAPHQWGQELASHIPTARLTVVEGSDHLPWFGDPGEIIDAIATFIGEKPVLWDTSRRLMTVMFTDIVDSTLTAVDMGDSEWTRLLDRHNGMMRELLDEYSGEEVKTTGDGFLMVFNSSAGAVECGYMALHEMPQIGLSLRAGVHTGEVEVLPDDVLGISVNTAARITALADRDEVLVSRSARDLAVGARLDFEDRGEHQLKGVPGMWQLYSVRDLDDEIVIDLRQPKELHAGDHVSVFLAKRAPAALRSLAGLTTRRH